MRGNNNTDMAEMAGHPGPVDFEIVARRGIHPFYLEMEMEEVVLASAGWKVSSALGDDHMQSINLKFAQGSRFIEVSLVKMATSWHPAESYFVFFINSEFCRMPGMRWISSYSKKYITDYFGLKFKCDDGTGFDGLFGENSTGDLTIAFLGRKKDVSISLDTSRP